MASGHTDLDRTIGHLPYVNSATEQLTEVRAQRVLTALERLNPNLITSLRRQISAIETEVRADVGTGSQGDIILTAQQLRGAIARAATRGCVQASYDGATSMADVQELTDMLMTDVVQEDTAATMRDMQATLFDADFRPAV